MSALIRAMVARKRAAAANDEAFRQRHDQIVAEARGEQGPKGDKPDHEWKGTKLRFEKPDGSWGKFVDLKGKDGKTGTVIVGGGGGGSFNPALLDVLPTTPLLSDYVVIERNGVAYRVAISAISEICGGNTIPTNVVTVNGAVLTVNSENVTVGPAADEDNEMQYSKRVDSTNNDTVIYRGEAAPGSADDSPVWRIVRIEFPSDGDVIEKWAGGTSAFSYAWTDRETLTYL